MRHSDRDFRAMMTVLVLAALAALLAGCATCKPDCTDMNQVECEWLQRSCQQANNL